jgi:hypothetical protein
MLGDQGSSLPTTDVTVRRNHFFKPLSWQRIQPNGTPNGSWDGIRWLVKNHFEVKFAQRVLVEGNYFQNNWAQGQDGTAVATFGGGSYVTSDVMYRSNIIRNSGYMFSVQTVVGTPPLIARIAWLNNLGLEIAGRMLFINHAATDLWLEHNTGAPMDGVLSEHWAGNGPGGAVQFALDAPGRNPRMTIKRNVFGLGVYGMINLGSALQDDAAYDLWMPDRTFAENALYGWSGRLVSGVTPYASAASAGVDLVTGTLIAGSPLIGAGSDGKDIGVDFVQLAAAQTGTQTEPQRKRKGRGGA